MSGTLVVDATELHAGTLTPPLSKSDAHRALVVGHILGLDSGQILQGIPEHDLPNDVRVIRQGLSLLAQPGDVEVDCADGGAPFRFLAALASVRRGTTTLTGTERLAERPHAALLESLRDAVPNADIQQRQPWPLVIRGGNPRGVWRVDGTASSQFVSGVLLAAASVCSAGTQRIEQTGQSTSAGYVEMTLSWLRRGGFQVENTPTGWSVSPGTPARALPAVPGDWSSLGYLLVLAWAAQGSVERVDLLAPHPDAAVVPLLSSVGLALTQEGPLTRVSGALRGGLRVDATVCPDLVPTLVALACVAPAPSVFTGMELLRHKESDRFVFCVELARGAGAEVTVNADTLTVGPGARRRSAFSVVTQDDHRRTMAAVTLASLLRSRVTLVGEPSVGKSFPGFFTQVKRVGIRVQR